MKIEFSEQIFEKIQKNAISWKCVELFNVAERTDRQADRQEVMTKLIFAFRNIAKST